MVKTLWKGNMNFEAITPDGVKVPMGIPKAAGGEGDAPTPKILLVVGLTGCTGMDIVSLFEKMKVTDYTFRIEADYHTTEEHPKIYDRIHLKYIFHFAAEPPKDKVVKAIELSQSKYCSVSAMLRKATEITYEIVYE